MNPYHLLMAKWAQGYRPPVRDTNRLLRGILVVRMDSAIKRVAALDGKVAPNALGASLLIRADLHNLFGIHPQPRKE